MEQDTKIVHVNVKRTFFFVRVAEATMTAKYSKSLGYFDLPWVLPALPPPAKADLLLVPLERRAFLHLPVRVDCDCDVREYV